MHFVELKQPAKQGSQEVADRRLRHYRSHLSVWIYTAAILLTELIGAYRNPLLAITLHAFLLLVLLGHAVVQEQQLASQLLPVLALVPLLRILSLTVITSLLPTIYLYALVAIPLAVAIFLVARLLKLSWAEMGVRKAPWAPQAAIALSGLPLSLGGYWLLQPTPLLNQLAMPAFVIAAVILVVCAAAVEEILFRGALQQAAQPLFGASTILYASLVYAISYISWQSVEYLGVALLLGLYFGWCAKRTGALWGVTLAHGAINIGMLLVWPLVL